MPTYEYRCLKCGKIFVVVQGIKDARLETHEECGGKVERLISGGGILMTERKGGRAESGEGFDDFGGAKDEFGGGDFGGEDDLGDSFGDEEF